MKQRGNIILVVLICLIIIPVHLSAGENIGVTTDTVKIGGLVDFTGPLSSTYQTLIEGLRIYIRHVNDQGGIHGRKIKHVAEDDRYSIPGAMSGFKKLIFRDKVLALAPGASGLGHTHAIIPLAEKNKIPLLAATNEYKYYNPVRRYVFAPLPFYEDQVKIIFKYIMEDMGDKDPKIAVAYPDVASGKVTLEASRKQAKKHGIKLVEETVIPIMVGDCFSQVIGLKRLKPEYVIVHGYVANTVSFLKDAQRGGLHCKFFVVQYGCSEETVRIAKKATKKMMGVNCFGSWHNDSPGMVKLREITLKYAPNSGSRTRNYMQGWFVALMTCLGLERTGRDLTRESFVDGLEKIRDYDTGGICGVISYGPADHKSIEEHRMYKVDVEKEVLVPLTGWRRAEE
ncbi:MAG: ABC transporter substrate-binding protein [Thermodesulfobacteriota bacterium]|nr:ABC transporter substrate-binding protein [Thermodesulfobacteriota bacterium]